MEKIALVTDSTCDLSQELQRQYDIRVIPLQVMYSVTETYRDRIDIMPEEIFRRMEKDETPKTSLPKATDIMRVFDELKEEGYTHILAMTVSSGLSGTYNHMRSLAQEVEGMVIEVIDSKILSLGMGIPMMELSKAIKSGCNFEKIVDLAKDMLDRTRGFFTVSTLNYLRKGGRIGHLEGTLGELLQIKPIMTMDEEGRFTGFKKVRGRKKSLTEMVETFKEVAGNHRASVAIMHGNAMEEAVKVMEEIKKVGNIVEYFIDSICPVIAIHAGPGTVAMIVYKHKDEEN